MDSWEKISRLSEKSIRRLQNQKLCHFINRQLYPFSPYYQKLFRDHKLKPKHIRKIEDLKNIPFLSKTDLIGPATDLERFREFILQPDKQKIFSHWSKFMLLRLALESALHGKNFSDAISDEYRPVFITFTTGTTNRPVPFVYSQYDISNLYISGARMINIFRMEKTEKAINFFPYAPHLAFWQVVFGGFSSGVLILSTGGGKVMSSEGNVSALMKMRPSVILGVPSYVYHVLRIAQEKGYSMDFVKKIVLGASRVSDVFKVRLMNLLKSMGAGEVSVFGTYGFTEAKSAWVECPTGSQLSSGYHLYPDKEIFEVVDPQTGAVKKEGEDGELVYTSIDSRASAVIRYRSGDFVKGGITYQPCPFCQRTVPRISSDITRLSDVKDLQLSKIKGTLVNLNHFVSVLANLEQIIEWQLEIRKKDNDPFEVDELIIYISVKDGIDKTDFEQTIKKEISSATEITPNEIVFLPLEQLVKRLELETSNKEKRIIDLRPK